MSGTSPVHRLQLRGRSKDRETDGTNASGHAARAEEGLAFVSGTGFLTFLQLRGLDYTSLYLCRESRRQVARTVRVTKRTPRTLWCRSNPSSAIGSRSASGGGHDRYNGSRDICDRFTDTPSDSSSAATRSNGVQSVGPLGAVREGANGLGAGSVPFSLTSSPDASAPSPSSMRSGPRTCSMYPLIEVLPGTATISYVNRDAVNCDGSSASGGNDSDSRDARRVQTPGGEALQANTPQWQDPASHTTHSVGFSRTLSAGDEAIACPGEEDGGVDLGLTRPTTVPTAATKWDVAARLPLARITRILWTLPAAELMAKGFRWPHGVTELQFDDCSGVTVLEALSVEAIEGPSFAEHSTGPLEPEDVTLPPGLKCLRLGKNWNIQLHAVRELASLEIISFPPHFNQPLSGAGIAFARGLREMELGSAFNQPLIGVKWPPLLEKIRFSRCFDQPMEGVGFPTELQEIIFGNCFDREIGGVDWPKGLKVLVFGNNFNQALVSPGAFERAPLGRTYRLPDRLKHLDLGCRFNWAINGSELPDGLESLRLGHLFGYVSSVRWPSNLKRLHLECEMGSCRLADGRIFGHSFPIALPPILESLKVGDYFDLPLTAFAMPPTLKVLDVGYGFNHPIGGVDGDVPLLPDGLEELRLSGCFNRTIENIQLPIGLKRLVMDKYCKFNHSLTGVLWPPGLEELNLGGDFNQPMEGTTLPGTLRDVSFGRVFTHSLQAVILPDGLTRLSLCFEYPVCHLQTLGWPRSLRSVCLGASRVSRDDLAAWIARRQQD